MQLQVRPGMASLVSLILLSLGSCSWIATDRSSVEAPTTSSAESQKNQEVIGESVPKEKYLALLAENEELKAKLGIVPTSSTASTAIVEEVTNLQPATIPLQTEPVDLRSQQVVDHVDEPAVLDDGTVMSAVQKIQQAMRWQQAGKSAEAFKVYRELEQSPSKQVQVQAKYQTGLLFFAQKEYDLALQAFEQVIKNYAFSGLVIKSVEFAMMSAEKLGLTEKQAQYLSILRDVFKVSA